jgi:hypothetical protein
MSSYHPHIGYKFKLKIVPQNLTLMGSLLSLFPLGEAPTKSPDPEWLALVTYLVETGATGIQNWSLHYMSNV